MAQRFRVVSDHAEEIACGQMVEAGEETSRVRPSDSFDKRLIDEGRLLPLPPKRQPRKSTKEDS
jgi:hypothetical protein